MKQLPPKTVVFFVSFWRDRVGNSYAAEKILPCVTDSSTAPVYTHADTFLIDGVVGDVLVHGRNQGHLAGKMALQILRGASPESIPVASQSTIPVFDHNALNRWQIDPALLPSNAVIINQSPPSLYEKHTGLVWIVIAAFAGLLALVAGLTISIAFRQRAEHALRQSESRFRALIELSPIPILLERKRHCLYVNLAFTRLVGSPTSEMLIGHPLLNFFPSEKHEKITAYLNNPKTNRSESVYLELDCLLLDGSRFFFGDPSVRD